ncbi:stalk domain-containing protein [Paenibacillus sp. GCM10027626]|uniref:stalk domain-containing protein n=1 Tax=Paenibacillus sp. GCM10027626 TaxID=3273411 RepID=UPI003639FD46
MNVKLKQRLLLPVLAAGLMLTPVLGMPGQVNAAPVQSTAVQSSVISVYVDGKKLPLQPAPITVNGTTLVPMRAIFAALKANVNWEPQTKTIFATKDHIKISLQIGAAQAMKNGKAIKLQVPARQAKGATYVPLRFVAEALGAKIEFDKKTSAIRITSAEQQWIDEEEEWDDYEDAAADAAAAASQMLSVDQIVQMNDNSVVMIATDRSQGSGVVIDSNRILTNFHVMRDASEATITTLYGSQVEVEGIVGYDEAADLAIIQTKEKLNIDPVVLGDGYNVRKGDHVVAIGSPLGLQNTASDGVVSNIIYDGAQLFQISAPIDHGSSGGALFNDSGELIGITTSGIDISNANLNFAVSVMNVNMLINEINDTDAKKIGFLPRKLPESLEGVSTDDIRLLMNREFGSIQTSHKTAALKSWDVKRDASGWLVLSTTIDPAFYMVYGHADAEDLRMWAINAGTELRRMLPKDTIRLTIYYDQQFSFEPRDFKADEVTAQSDGTWRVRYPVVDVQAKEKMHVQVRS